jgi:ABC-type branched-subunit amino acid transport system permease subunit
VSLNIVNGLTGQFSIGHAGFMAVGEYLSASVSLALKDDRLGFVPEGVSDQVFFSSIHAFARRSRGAQDATRKVPRLHGCQR